MGNSLRVKLIGEDPEIEKLETIIRGAGLPVSRSRGTEEACESQELESADVFVLGAKEFSQAHVNQIQRLQPQPEILLAAAKKIPNLAKVISPGILYLDWSQAEILHQLEHGVSLEIGRAHV